MLIFTIERAEDYDYEPGDGKYPYTDTELATARYVVTLNNGDSHLLQRVTDIEALVSGELFLAGFSDAVLHDDEQDSS